MLHQCQAWEKLQLAFCLILLTTLQFYHPHLLTLPHSVTLLAVHWMPAPVYQLLYACYVVVHSLSRVRLVTTPGLQHARLPCPSTSQSLNSHPSSRRCHPTIPSSVTPFSSCLQSFPASGSFPMSRLFSSGGQSTGASASASVLPMNIQHWFPLGWTDWISLLSKGLSRSRVFSNTTVWKHQFFSAQLMSNSHLYMTTGKTIPLTIWTIVGKVMSLLFNILSRFVTAFLQRSKRLLISWLQSPSTVILEPKKIVCHCFHCFLIYLPWSDVTRCHDLSFLNVEL